MDPKDTETKAEGAETTEMGKKLKGAGKKAEEAKAARREREVKGSHLLPKLMDKGRLGDLTVEDKSGFHLITGPGKGKKVYVAKKGGRVDLSGFSIEAPAVTQVTEEEARAKHLGKVRGMLDFTKSDHEVLAAYDAALAELAKEPPPAEKPAKAAKAEKAAEPETEQTTDAE